MAEARSCHYRDCYYNHNLENACLHEKITVGQTGVCESLIHCDDYLCSECERFDVCSKEKKEQFLRERGGL